MDSFESVRLDASNLYVDIIDKAAAPKLPLDLVNAAIAHLELEVAWLSPGDPALKGARAVFDDQSGTIFAEDVGGPSERCLAHRPRDWPHPHP